MKTPPFALRGGNYTVGWESASQTGTAFCGGRLSSVDDGVGDGFVSTMIKGLQRGESQLYRVKPGQYFVDMYGCGDWKVAVAPLGSNATAALDSIPTAPSTSGGAVPTTSQAARHWTMAFDRAEASSTRPVGNDAGVTSPRATTGSYLQVFFRVRNVQMGTSGLSVSDFSLTDAQGRNYSSEFELRQTQPDGPTSAFLGSVAPDATTELSLTFDVPEGTNGLVLHLQSGGEIDVS